MKQKRPVYLVVMPLGYIDGKEAYTIIEIKQSRLAADIASEATPGSKVKKGFVTD